MKLITGFVVVYVVIDNNVFYSQSICISSINRIFPRAPQVTTKYYCTKNSQIYGIWMHTFLFVMVADTFIFVTIKCADFLY